jgi:hypothetical protein
MPDDVHLTVARIRAALEGTGAHAARLRGATRRKAPIGLSPEMIARLAGGKGNLLQMLGGQFDAAAGPGAGRFVADTARLLDLLEILAEGTVDDAIARETQALERAPAADASAARPEVRDGRIVRIPAEAFARTGHERRIAELRAITQEEIDAVFACLDEIEKVYPREADRIRMRHDAAYRERHLQEAAELRAGDPSRPELTEARVRRVIDVLVQCPSAPRKVQAFFEARFPDDPAAAAKALGAAIPKAAAKVGEDPDAFVRDLWWTEYIAALVARHPSLDQRLSELKALTDPAAWLNPHQAPGRAKRVSQAWAGAMTGQYETMRRIGPDEEEDVRRLLPEIQPALDAARGRVALG